MKTIRFVLPVCLLVLSAILVYALPPFTKTVTKNFLTRTNKTLVAAQTALKNGKVSNGDFSLAVRHERFAAKMYQQNKFEKAIYHSRRARILGQKVIRANKGKFNPEAFFNKEESQFNQHAPNDREIDDAISRDGLFGLKDSELLEGDLKIKLD